MQWCDIACTTVIVMIHHITVRPKRARKRVHVIYATVAYPSGYSTLVFSLCVLVSSQNWSTAPQVQHLYGVWVLPRRHRQTLYCGNSRPVLRGDHR
eukprot:7233276-Pyramimonas_sp.AAC.1